VCEYLRQFRETRNKCYNLTIRERGLLDLAFAGLASYLREKMEGKEFLEVNLVMQKAMAYKNRAKDQRWYGWFKEWGFSKKKKENVSYVDGESASEEETEVCVAEWVDTPADKPIPCSFLRPNVAKKDEVKFTFFVSKCDKLFDVLVRGGVIYLTKGHVIPTPELLVWKKYYKWHNSYSHTTNQCNYFHQQVQSALNDGRLTLGEGNAMKLDVDHFLIHVLELGQKKILMHSDQVATTKANNVIVSDDLKNWMIKPKNLEEGVWKENTYRRLARKWDLCQVC
jgi:hypothetical protein